MGEYIDLKRLKKEKAIIAILVLAAAVYAFMKPSTHTEENVKELVELSQVVRGYYKTKPGYWGLNTEKAVELKIVPEKMIDNGRIVSQTGREILLGEGFEGNMVMPGGRFFDVVYKGLSKKECIDLASYEGDEEYSLGLLSININGREFSWGVEDKLPIGKREAAKTCAQGSYVIFRYE